MAISAHLAQWRGHKLVDFQDKLSEPEQTAYALRITHKDKETFAAKLKRLVDAPGSDKLQTLIIGTWSNEMYDNGTGEVIELLCSHRERLKSLRNIFLGEITYQEFEISWLVQSDISPLLVSYPKLEWLAVRGGDKLAFSHLDHSALRGLIVETGGLATETVDEIFAGKLPALEHLELWFGDDNYGGDTDVTDLEPLLKACPFPKLRSLGLCNACYTDEIVEAVADSPLLERLEELDLSKGTLGDEGAKILLEVPGFAKLKKLDLQDNFLSPGAAAQIGEYLPNVTTGEQRDAEEYDGDRYCSVSE